jgi:hypothetical protein
MIPAYKDVLTLAADYTSITLERIDGVDASNIDDTYPPGDHR